MIKFESNEEIDWLNKWGSRVAETQTSLLRFLHFTKRPLFFYLVLFRREIRSSFRESCPSLFLFLSSCSLLSLSGRGVGRYWQVDACRVLFGGSPEVHLLNLIVTQAESIYYTMYYIMKSDLYGNIPFEDSLCTWHTAYQFVMHKCGAPW